MVDDAYTRNEDGELAVRTVSTSGDTGTNPNDVFTRDDEGRLAIRTTGGGGGDQHNLGYFATQAALEEAHPTAEAGDWAIVGATDTVWLWDSDNSQWVDSDQKGQVTSVNGQTGDVTLTASDVGAATTAQGAKADTAVQPADLATVATTGDYDDLLNKPTIPPAQVNSDWNANSGVAQILNKPTIPDTVQYSTMPTASADNLGKIVQFIGTTDVNYTNGYFYKCVSDGQDPATYSWTRVDIQPAGASYTAGTGIDITNDVVSVTSPVLVNTATGTDSLTILGTANANQDGINIGVGSSAARDTIAIGINAKGNRGTIIIGRHSSNFTPLGSYGVAIGDGAETRATLGYEVAIGTDAKTAASHATQLGSGTNSDANTFKVGNANGNFEIMSADGTIPADRLTHAINKYSTMPTASASNAGWIVQFTGTTDSTYTHGYLYECKAQGTDPETYAWEEVSLGGASYTAGTGIDITNDVISVTTPVIESGGALVAGTGYNGGGSLTRTTRFGRGAYCADDSVAFGNSARSNSNWATALGSSAYANSNNSVGVGAGATATGNNSVALGYMAQTNAVGAIQINSKGNTQTNSDANTFKVANANGNFELMNANGNLPADRLASTTGLADGNYRLRCTITNGVPTLSWVAE